MMAAIVIVSFLIFLGVLLFTKNETPPAAKFVTYEELKNDFPRWFVGLAVVLSFIFKPKGKMAVFCTIALAGFAMIAAVFGNDIFDFFLGLFQQFRQPNAQPKGK